MSEKNSSTDLLTFPFTISVPPHLKHFIILSEDSGFTALTLDSPVRFAHQKTHSNSGKSFPVVGKVIFFLAGGFPCLGRSYLFPRVAKKRCFATLFFHECLRSGFEAFPHLCTFAHQNPSGRKSASGLAPHSKTLRAPQNLFFLEASWSGAGLRRFSAVHRRDALFQQKCGEGASDLPDSGSSSGTA